MSLNTVTISIAHNMQNFPKMVRTQRKVKSEKRIFSKRDRKTLTLKIEHCSMIPHYNVMKEVNKKCVS